MCGIAGIISFGESYRIESPMLEDMATRISHRGPDARDYWINHRERPSPDQPQVGLAFCRLAILDLDARAMQPMNDMSHHIVFNGEIYNFPDLKRHFVAKDWLTTGDTEVLLRVLATQGPEGVKQLNGMFALAMWNANSRTLLLARDRLGQKPLYYTWSADKKIFAFASQPTALRALPWVDWTIRHDGVEQYLRYGYVPRGGSGTIYKHIYQLPPATWLQIGTNTHQEVRYFDPNRAQAAMPKPAAYTRRLVLAAVKRQMVSDVPLGCFLSGGVDSSIIAAAMVQVAEPNQPVLTFSIGFDDRRYDETPYATEVAVYLGTQHRKFTVKPDAATDLPLIAASLGEPFGDSSILPTHYLSREAAKHVKVALSGDGGDELFGGYERYRAVQLAMTARYIPRPLRGLLSLLPGYHPKSTAVRIRRFMASLDVSPDQRYTGYLRLFDDAQLQLLGVPHDGFAIDRFLYRVLNRQRDVMQAAAALDRLMYLPGDTLTKLDRASMLHGLEVRSPLLDKEIVQFAAGLPSRQLYPKRLLHKAFAADLPPRVFHRRKMGFAVPIGQWLRTQLRPMLHDLLFASDSFASAHFAKDGLTKLVDQHHRQIIDHSERLYALLMLELWWKTQTR